MIKKILCLILATLMIIAALPISVLASEVAKATENTSLPVVNLTSLYSYNDGNINEFRALPDAEGTFYIDISLNKAPEADEEITVYYRTTDDSAVAKWGDYESVGNLEEAFVTLNKANGYKERVLITSTVMDYGFYTGSNKDRIITRRFLFELLRVDGNAELQSNQSKFYCYLRANNYNYQSNTAKINASAWPSNMRSVYYQKADEELEILEELYPGFGWEHREHYRNQINQQWEEGIKNVKYDSCYYTPPIYINTPWIYYKGKHSDNINLKFPNEFYHYAASGACNIGISINGTCTRKYWDSTGEATFHLYYDYQGERKIALSLYLQGEFDDSTFFGWEHAFEYAIEGLTSNNRDDHMDENFIGFTLYDNDGNVAYEVKANSRSDYDEDKLCNDLKRTIVDKYAVELMAEYNEKTKFNDNYTSYYLKLPSNFALADSYSYEFISDSTDKDEIRWLENVKLTFAFMGTKEPFIAKDEKGNQMVSTNLDTIKEGDPLRMSIRFDKLVYAHNEENKLYITTDIYNDKGSCLAQGVQLQLKQLGNNGANYYAWDTLVFESALPEGIDGSKIASLRNIQIKDDEAPIKGFFTNLPLLGKTIANIYCDRDFRTPVAILGSAVSDSWSKSKSLDLYVNIKENTAARFNDYVTVYYQWTNSTETPQKYSSKVAFHTDSDGEILKTIIGSGNGEMYLHLKAVSSYGKFSYSSYGPFKFDNLPPKLSADDITLSGNLMDRTLSIPFIDDNGGVGLRDLTLYYITKNGEEKALKRFTAEDFKGDSKTLTHTISHKDVGACVDIDGNVILDRKDVSFYWILSDKLGNTSEKTAEFVLTFDTNDYIESEISSVGAYDISSEPGDAKFKSATKSVDDYKFIYNYRYNNGNNFKPYAQTDRAVYYAFAFTMVNGIFGETDNGIYGANVSYRGETLDEADYSVVKAENGVYLVLFYSKMDSGRYDIQLTRREGDSIRVSRVFSVYATDSEADETAVKKQIYSGTLLSNSVYQFSAEYPYFYYKDINGVIQSIYYNNTKQPATFSSFAKAKEYAYFMELSDIYLIQLNDATASALNSGTTGYLIARGENVTPQEGQYWIRYKSESWTPTSGDSSWVYYYYGMSGELSESSFSANLQSALNTVANRIVSYGKTVILTDTSLFLGTAMGEKMLDKYGMPYLLPGQIHNVDELSAKTMCENVWSSQVGFAADKNIYKSNVSVGVNEVECPIVGNFTLPEDSIFQYVAYDQYIGNTTSWQSLNIKSGESFINVLTSSGIYYIREISADGVSVYMIYVDKESPKVSFFNTDDQGNFKEIPIDGVLVLDVRTKDLYIGNISYTEYDRLSYVAVYKVSNLSLVSVYTADELDGSPIKLDDGNYYIVISDRSGNHYTVTAKVSSTGLECNIKESTDKYIRLTCNRRDDQILRYEIYLNGTLVTSTYAPEQTFDKAGLYTIYVQDIYGNEFSQEYIFNRNYPTVTWKYLGSDGKYHEYDPNGTSANGFVLTWVSDNQYKISTAVKTRFSFSGNYDFEFIGNEPDYIRTDGAETVVTIEAGQSFTLKVYYKNHKDCYTVYSGVVDVTPPSINVSANVDILQNGEYNLFGEWAKGNVGDVIAMKDLYYVLSEVTNRIISNGGTVSSDNINISAGDANGLSLIEVYYNGSLIEKQDTKSGFSQIIVEKWGDYRIVAKDTIGNISEFTFKNGKPDGVKYFVDGAEKNIELHGYLNFNEKNDYTKVDFGNKNFQLNIEQNSDIFISVGSTNIDTKIYGFRISDGQIYPLTYQITLDKNNNNAIDLVVGDAILDMNSADFDIGKDYLISDGEYEIYASISADKIVSIKVYASNDTSKVISVSARIEVTESHTMFVSAEISTKSSNVSFKDFGTQTNTDIKLNNGFIIDESIFEAERIESIRLYYSKLNDLDVNKLYGKTNIYTPDREYDDEGFYLLIVKNRYGNEKVYKISISRSFGVTSSVTFGDGYKIHYSKDYNGTLYSNNEIILDILDEGVTVNATLNGVAYTGFAETKSDGITYLLFSAEGAYEVRLTDSYGNVIIKQLVINKSSYTVDDNLLIGFNEKALKRDEGYTNQKISVDKAVYDKADIYYLAIQYGEKLNVLYDAFSENLISIDEKAFIDVIGCDGDGVYKVICRNRYGAVVTKDIHYRGTPTLKLERTTRSKSESEIYDLNHALSLGFWSNNTLSFSTDAKTYVFAINGSVVECPKTLVFENAGDFGSFEYEIKYIDEYGFEYIFKAYLIRKNIVVNIPESLNVTDINGLLNTKSDVFVTFGENIYATYTRDNGEETVYHSGDVLKKDGTYRFTVLDYAGNATTVTIKKDTAVEFSFIDSVSGNIIQNGSVVNSSKIRFDSINKDSAYIEKVSLNGVIQTDFSGNKFTEDGKWELILSDDLGNREYFCFYIITRSQNGFEYSTPHEYHITEMWYDNGDGVKVSYMSFVNHTDFTSSFNFTENGKYTVVMSSDVTGMKSIFDFTVNTTAPDVSLVGCNNGETTINDVTLSGYKVGDTIRVYRATKTGEQLVEEVEITSLSTKIPTITEGGKYRIIVESEAGVQTELSLVRKHVMNTAGSVFILIIIGLSVIGLFTGLIYRNKSKTDD